ncbi:hypothetical protein [Lysobacter sp. CA196]
MSARCRNPRSTKCWLRPLLSKSEPRKAMADLKTHLTESVATRSKA